MKEKRTESTLKVYFFYQYFLSTLSSRSRNISRSFPEIALSRFIKGIPSQFPLSRNNCKK